MTGLLKRDLSDSKQTLGTLQILNSLGDEVFKTDTLELADLGNKPQVSCIPKGIYNVLKVPPTSAIPYLHLAIQNVPNRSGICIHVGNYATGKNISTKGCVLVGKGYGDMDGDGYLDIKNSKVTFEKLMNIVPDSFKLVIE